ncbi:hypothetical protein FIV42_06310 [Persicimonas caeni]|uniref:Porin n=1 Tax=Persicimonas caeni TaxID=2292766 RepID=A0A4Y6PPW6_PERCE|nr:hypothetical protein [Persicimonas caeni]QDG50358.1 hypothetical protein FIV42_06310 [Persicimonas caeni]QED31579.1 hypothetical protein FRD00_06305 [Persicimonas caeni]
MKSYRSLIHVAAAVVVLSLVGVQDAEAARRDSLSGNLLIEDRDDVFIWPQLTVNNTNLVGFDYGPAANAGNAYLFWGSDTAAMGVAVHRGDLLGNEIFPYGGSASGNPGLAALGDTTGPLASQLGVNSGTVVDLFAGFDVGGGLAGGRLALGRGAQSTTPADPDADETSASETFVLLQGGYSMTGPMTIDTALSIAFSTGGQDVGDDTPLEGTAFGVGLKARGYADLGQPFELGFLGDVAYNSVSIDTTPIGGDETTTSGQSNFIIQGGAGPVWEVGGEDNGTVIAGYGVLSYASASSDADVDDDDVPASGTSQAILPGFNIASDIELTDWLYFRSGAQYLWVVDGTSQEVPGEDNDNETSASGPGGFGWNAGIGIEAGNFRFDGSFSNNFLTQGPNFIGGGSGFLTMASAEYAWE